MNDYISIIILVNYCRPENHIGSDRAVRINPSL